MKSDASLGAMLTQVADHVVRLVVQHVQLARAELDGEVRALGLRTQTMAMTAAKAVPFLLAGVVLMSVAAAQFAGLLLEPWLGRLAGPGALLLVGVGETIVAVRWLRRVVEGSGRPLAAPLPGRRGETMLATQSISLEEKPYG